MKYDTSSYKKFRKKSKHEVVFFDLETTDLIKKDNFPDILQIGAVDSSDHLQFNECLLPTKKVNYHASQVNRYTTDLKRLYHKGERVHAHEMKDGLQMFIDWLNVNFDGPVVLVAHNCFNFDAKVLLTSLKKYGVEYRHVILGFSDSLVTCKQIFDPPWKLSAILEKIGVDKEVTHDAHDDANDLRVVVTWINNQLGAGDDFSKFIMLDKWYRTLAEQELEMPVQELEISKLELKMVKKELEIPEQELEMPEQELEIPKHDSEMAESSNSFFSKFFFVWFSVMYTVICYNIHTTYIPLILDIFGKVLNFGLIFGILYWHQTRK